MIKLSAAASFFIAACAAFAPCVYAQDSTTNLSNAATDSGIATARLSEAGVRTVVGVVAVPVTLGGFSVVAVGYSAASQGEDMYRYANEPLKVSPETVIAQPAPKVPYSAQKPAVTAPAKPAGAN